MTHEMFERDDDLAIALREVAGDPMQERVEWEDVARAVRGRAAPELARRRWTRRGRRFAPPAALAASIAFLLLLVAPQPRTGADTATVASAAAASESISVDELLDAGVSEVQFRALLFGAAEADELLLIAAGEQQLQ